MCTTAPTVTRATRGERARTVKREHALFLLLPCLALAQAPEVRTSFRVKYVAQDAVYLDGGRSAGLAEGMELSVTRDAYGAPGPSGAVAELEVRAVAESSAVCEIRTSKAAIQPGDSAVLSTKDIGTIRALRSYEGSRKYVQVVTFTEGDPLDEEAREQVPHPPSPSVNRARGRIGFEYNTLREPGGAGLNSSQLGLVFRGDVTRIGGSYWNLSGYWRGRLNSRTGGSDQETLTDLLNRTYHLTFSYDNPQSRWRAGFGRLYLPWASSLETIDGGYMGRRLGEKATVGMFAGSTPDPTSWNYNPDRQMLGTFANYETGSFESIHYSSTAGVAVTRIRWRPERQFAFFENALFFKRNVSIYHNLEVDQFRSDGQAVGNGTAISRSFFTLRLQPHKILSLDFSHNYFRNIPTFDPRLVGTGLVDKLLFQGVSAGVRLDLPYRLSLYSSLGRSDRSGDARRSLNQMYGVTFAGIWRTGIRADARYSRFDSAFGRGSYRSLSFTREIGEALRFEFQAGEQNFVSVLTDQNRARFANANVDWFIGTHYFLGSGYTRYRGRIQNYDQLYTNLGYRF